MNRPLHYLGVFLFCTSSAVAMFEEGRENESDKNNTIAVLKKENDPEFVALYGEWRRFLNEPQTPLFVEKDTYGEWSSLEEPPNRDSSINRVATPKSALAPHNSIRFENDFVPRLLIKKVIQPSQAPVITCVGGDSKPFRPMFLNQEGDINLSPREQLVELWAEQQNLMFNVEKVPVKKKQDDLLRTHSERDLLHLLALFGKNESTCIMFDSREESFRLSRKEKCLASLSGMAGVLAGVAYTPVFEQAIPRLRLVDFSKGNGVTYGVMAANFLMFATDNGLRDFAIVARPTKSKFIEVQSDSVRYLKNCLIAGHAILQPLLLWNVELLHQRDAGAVGFSPYIATATFLSPFLAYNSAIQDNEDARYINTKDSSTTVRERLFVYGLPLVNSLTRGLAYYSLLNQTLEHAGWHEDNSRQMTSVLGGLVVSNGVSALLEIDATKSFIQKRKDRSFGKSRKSCCGNLGDYSAGILSFTYGAYNSLPIVAMAENVLKDQSLGLRIMAYIPLACGAGLQKQNYLTRSWATLKSLFHKPEPVFFEAGISRTEESIHD